MSRRLCGPDFFIRRSLLLQALKDRDTVGDGDAAHVEDTGNARVADLKIARFGSQLHGGKHVHGNPRRAARMALCLQPARRVDRQEPGLFSLALQCVYGAFAGPGKPRCLVFDQYGDGETVMRPDKRKIAKLAFLNARVQASPQP